MTWAGLGNTSRKLRCSRCFGISGIETGEQMIAFYNWPNIISLARLVAPDRALARIKRKPELLSLAEFLSSEALRVDKFARHPARKTIIYETHDLNSRVALVFTDVHHFILL